MSSRCRTRELIATCSCCWNHLDGRQELPDRSIAVLPTGRPRACPAIAAGHREGSFGYPRPAETRVTLSQRPRSGVVHQAVQNLLLGALNVDVSGQRDPAVPAVGDQ